MPDTTPAPEAKSDAAPFLGRRLRLGINDDGKPWPAWARRVVAQLAAHPGLELVRIPCCTRELAKESPNWVRRWFDRFDQRRLRGWRQSRGVEESSLPVPDLPYGSEQEEPPDVIWHLGAWAEATPLPSVPYGVWHYVESDVANDVFDHKQVTTALLVASRDKASHLLGTAETRVHSTSPAITAFQRDEAGARLVLDAVERLIHHAWSPELFWKIHEPWHATEQVTESSNIRMLVTLFTRWMPRMLAARWKASVRAQWTVGLAPLNEGGPGTMQIDRATWLMPPDDSFVADPFLWQHEGQWYVFAEVLPFASGKGHIAVCTWSEGEGFGALKTVLCEETHLSYPFLFEHEGRLYLMPEHYNGGELLAYECVEFPHRWQPARAVKAGLRCADATLLQHEGRWWLFYTAVHGGASEDSLYACFADTPFGPWQAHPQHPLRSGLRGSRMAGAFIRRSDATLLRPGQEASACYGGATILFEVEALTPHDYREREVAVIDPSAFPKPWNERCHTWNERDGMVVFDACRSL